MLYRTAKHTYASLKMYLKQPLFFRTLYGSWQPKNPLRPVQVSPHTGACNLKSLQAYDKKTLNLLFKNPCPYWQWWQHKPSPPQICCLLNFNLITNVHLTQGCLCCRLSCVGVRSGSLSAPYISSTSIHHVGAPRLVWKSNSLILILARAVHPSPIWTPSLLHWSIKPKRCL